MLLRNPDASVPQEYRHLFERDTCEKQTDCERAAKTVRMPAFNACQPEYIAWVQENIPKKLGNPKVSSPTMPFTKDQIVSILAARPNYTGRVQRLRAFILLLRYSGMRIGDTATCARDRLNGRRFSWFSSSS
jgi:hypothetical protein